MFNFSLIGLDIGLSTVKAVLFSGQCVKAVASRACSANLPRPHWVECDPEVLLRACVDAIHDVMQHHPDTPLRGVGICACGNGCILLDEKGEVLRPAILSNDTRATSICDAWQEELWQDVLFPKTQQQLYPGQTSVLLRWIQLHEPEVYARIGHVLLIKDFLRWKLTGTIASDYSDMGATGLLDVKKRSYDAELLQHLGLESVQHALPPLKKSSEVGGLVNADAAQQTGLPESVPVVVGCLDCEASRIGSGVHNSTALSVIAGSWAIHQTKVEQPLDNRDLFLTMPSSDDDAFTVLEGSPTSSVNFEWYVKQQYAATSTGVSPYTHCIDEALSISPESSDLIYLPFLFGGPHSVSSSFLNISADYSQAHFARAVLEGIVFSHRYHIEKLKSCGLNFERLYLTGGPSRHSGWAQLFADGVGIDVVVSEEREVGALGAILLAGVGVGCWSELKEAEHSLERKQRVYVADVNEHAIYSRKYKSYQAGIEALSQKKILEH